MLSKLCSGTMLIASIFAASGSALAQDEKPFDGFYAGIETGYDRYKQPGGFQTFGDNSDSAIFYGGFSGWRKQLQEGIVLGIEARVGDSTGKINLRQSFGGDVSNIQLKAGRQFGFDFILGKIVSNGLLIFASGGYVNERTKVRSTSTNQLLPNINFSESEGGYRVGGGAEYRLNDTFNLRLTTHYQDAGTSSHIQVLAGVVLPF